MSRASLAVVCTSLVFSPVIMSLTVITSAADYTHSVSGTLGLSPSPAPADDIPSLKQLRVQA